MYNTIGKIIDEICKIIDEMEMKETKHKYHYIKSCTRCGEIISECRCKREGKKIVNALCKNCSMEFDEALEKED